MGPRITSLQTRDEGKARPETPIEPLDIGDTIGARFNRIADRFPDRIAITSGGSEVTFRYISTAANKLARKLLFELGPANEPVVILLNHDLPALIAVLGVIEAGKVYTVLEPDWPTVRLSALILDLGARGLVSNNNYADLAESAATGGCKFINLDLLSDQSESTNPTGAVTPDFLAGIYYTSGSTGRPKGVTWTHRGIMQRIRSDTLDYGIDKDDRIALLFSCSFGASVSNIFNALLNGASVRLHDIRRSSLAELTEWLLRESITIMHLPVALFQQWLTSLRRGHYFPSLRQVIPAGRLYRKDVEHFWRHVPMDCQLLQRFSTSETGMCTRFLIDRKTTLTSAVVPAGFPVYSMEVRLVGKSGRPVKDGEIGEITVKGRCMSTGYWRNPDLTRKKFSGNSSDPKDRIFYTGDLGRWRADGSLEHIGRKDFMVKIRGYRVEPSEVELALIEQDNIHHAVVVDTTAADAETVLVAFVVSEPGKQIQYDGIIGSLRQKLPSYMIPASIIVLDKLPLTATGKVDRHALKIPNLAKSTRPRMAPRNELERSLVKIWESCLGIYPLGIHDDFFELGGHSLQALRIIAEIERHLGQRLVITQLLDTSTIAALSEAISYRHAAVTS